MSPGGQSGYGRIFLIVCCLIVYGSLYPFQFHPREYLASPLAVLLQAWPAALDRFVVRDTIVNVILYAPLGIFGYLRFSQHFRSSAATVAVLAFTLVLSGGIEFAQQFEPSRYSSSFDVACNLTGSLVGIAIARLFSHWITTPVVAWSKVGIYLTGNAAAVLLGCWIAYQLIPGFPQLSIYHLVLKLRSFAGSASWSFVELVASIVDWLTVAAVVFEVIVPSAAMYVFAALMLLLPGRLFLDTRSVTGAECCGALLALMIWQRFWHKYQRPFFALACLSTAMILLRGLSPFQFSGATRFSWIPFAATLSYDQADAFVVFFRKCFLYGGAVWLLHKAGCRYWIGASWIAALLGAIEAIQTRLPRRTPEITDPLLALIMTVILHLADRHKSQAKPELFVR